MDTIMASLKMMPLQEYLLQGSILDAHRDNLLHRLNGLCDAIDNNMGFIGPERFRDHEMVFQLRASTPNVQPIAYRVRRSLDHPEVPWHLRYVGNPDIGDKSRHTLVRSCIDVGTSDNVVQFLADMGFRLDYECVVKGYLFRKGRMKVTVSEIYRMLQPGNLESTDRLTSSCLVELSVVAAQGQDQIQEDMKNFAEQLKPLVQLEKIDHRRLQQMSS